MRAGAQHATLGLPAGIAPLETLRRRQSHQDAATIDRWLARLRQGTPGDETTAMRERIEKLEERCRKLDERIQDLEARDPRDARET
jgi:hypothetical protein